MDKIVNPNIEDTADSIEWLIFIVLNLFLFQYE